MALPPGSTRPSPQAPRERLPLLDGLRTIAALGVMLFHLNVLFGVTSLAARGYLFVDLFFLLSGFVLTLSAEPAMAQRPPLAFARARLIRLWPLVALGTLAGGLAFLPWTGWRDTLPLVLAGLALIPLSRPGFEAFPLNGPQWSLFWELFANLLHAVLLCRLSNRWLVVLVGTAGLVLAGQIARTGACAMGPGSTDWWTAAPRVCWSYGLGIAMARHWRRHGSRPLLDWRLALAAPALFLQALAWLPLARAVGDGLAVLVVLPALFWAAANAMPPATAHPALERAGALSFPLYALHMPLLLFGSLALTPALGSALGALAAVAAAMVIVARGSPRRTHGPRATA